MSDALTSLLAVLDLEQIDDGFYRGLSEETSWGRVYGGQVLAQALVAAQREVDESRDVHSLHSYFLRPGDPLHPILYQVVPLLDAGTISSRRVSAIQHGQPLFHMVASFQRTIAGHEHFTPMPTAPDPETLPSDRDLEKIFIAQAPDDWKPKFNANQAIDFRPAQEYNLLQPHRLDPVRQLWMRPSGDLPDDRRLHECLLAYASDYFFLATATQPHAISFVTPGVRMATIDHSMWFHRPLRFDDWLLYHMESPSTSNGRGFVTGRVYDRSGRLVVSTAQEGIMRQSRGA